MLTMKWHRKEFRGEEGLELHFEGDSIDTLIEDYMTRQKRLRSAYPLGAIENLALRIELLQTFISEMLGKMDAKQVQEIVRGATYNDRYEIEEV